ncbi:MAG: hypothetical protein AAB634_00710 [Patescibacteria group bacterium]
MPNKFLIRFALIAVFTALAAAISFPLVSTYLADTGHDGHWYVLLAEGRGDEVMKPFSGRFLYPFLAGMADAYIPGNIGYSFFALGMISLFLFLLLNAFMLKRALPSPLLYIPILFLPYLLEMSREILVVDLFYLFLTALFFFALFYEKEWAAFAILFLLFLTRESTILLGLLILPAYWFRGKKKFFVATCLLVAFAVFVVGSLGSGGLPNPHHVGNAFYLVLKLTYNFFNNFFGIKLWVNTLAANCEPVIQMSLPSWPLFGSIRGAGLCPWNPLASIHTFFALFTIFGVAPTVFAYLILKKYRYILREAPFWLFLATLYGAAHFIIGVPAGTGVARIVAYGWPAFVLALPFLLKNVLNIDRMFLIKLSFAQIVVAWAPFVVQNIAGYTTLASLFGIAFAIPLHVFVYALMKKQKFAI